MKFSQRIGKTSIRDIIQRESIDERLRIKLYNLIYEQVFVELNRMLSFRQHSEVNEICRKIWIDFFDGIADEVPPYINHSFLMVFKKKYATLEWFEIYDLLEFLCLYGINPNYGVFASKANKVLEEENSAYRLVENKIIEITSELEIKELEEAFSIQITSIEKHLKSSLELLSSRKNPDYRNSIKESISAVEALCCKIVGDEKATLGVALKKVKQNYNLHSSLKSSFSALYGYTSDAGGIRHKLLEDDVEIKYEDAKYMLVSCSAFINYLQAKAK